MAYTPCSDTWTTNDLARLMDLTTVLADLTTQPNLVEQIPALLASTLHLEPTTLAVIRQDESGPAMVWFGYSTPNASSERLEQARQHVLDTYEQTKPLAAGEAPAIRDISGEGTLAYSQTAGELVLSRRLDESHRLVLVVTYHGPENSILTETLGFVGNHLTKLLGTLLAWTSDPSTLGAPFDRLTDREWIVLQSLNSDDGEKQLADRLQLSPHTLHSHIKAIYRKIGVQGRLPLLLQLQAAQRALRAKLATAAPSYSSASEISVAVG